jgi:hypothetical protein
MPHRGNVCHTNVRFPSAPEVLPPTWPKPLRCRLRLHWEDRENPETRDRYEVCVRCDAYRDSVWRLELLASTSVCADPLSLALDTTANNSK